MSDEVPDYPPGPRGPEDPIPGVRVTLSGEQARFVARVVEQTPGASAVQIEDRGAAYFDLTVYDAEGGVIAERTVFPLGTE